MSGVVVILCGAVSGATAVVAAALLWVFWPIHGPDIAIWWGRRVKGGDIQPSCRMWGVRWGGRFLGFMWMDRPDLLPPPARPQFDVGTLKMPPPAWVPQQSEGKDAIPIVAGEYWQSTRVPTAWWEVRRLNDGDVLLERPERWKFMTRAGFEAWIRKHSAARRSTMP